jgi:hypothetical protein
MILNRVNEALPGKRREAILGFETYRTSTGERIDVPLSSIPRGNKALYWNPRTQTIRNSTPQPPSQGYSQFKHEVAP